MRRQMLVRITQATCTLLLQVRHWRGPRYRVLPGSAAFQFRKAALAAGSVSDGSMSVV
jgi:hypothetical protein